jgi:hypothetical protein
MAPATLTAEQRLTAPQIGRAVAAILTAMAALIAHALLRDPRHVARIPALWGHINRARDQFTRLMARLAAGTPPARLRRTRAASRPAARSPTPTPTILPTSRAWLLDAIGWRVAGHRSQLEHLFGRPETAAIVAQCPQAARILRPILHMLGARLACLAPPGRPPRPRRARRAGPATTAAPPTTPPRAGHAASGPGTNPLDPRHHWIGPAETRPDRGPRPGPPCDHLRHRWPWAPLPAKKPA